LMSLSPDSISKMVHERVIRLLSAEYVEFSGISRTKARAASELDCFLKNGVGFAKGNFGITAFDTIASDPTYTVASGEAKLVPDLQTFAIPPYASARGGRRNIDRGR